MPEIRQPGGGAVDWNAEALQILTNGWLAGDRALEIAAQILGATRSAIIGKARREGLGRHPDWHGARQRGAVAGGRKSAETRRAKALNRPPKPPPPPKRPPPLAVLPDEITPTARPFETRRALECAWPLRIDGDWYACCAPAAGSFCRSHAQIAYAGTQSPAELYRYARAA